MTFFDLLKRVSNLKWSTDEPDPRTFDDVRLPVKIAMQQALLEIWHSSDFAFRRTVTHQTLPHKTATLAAPLGALESVLCDDKALKNAPGRLVFDAKEGRPRWFRFEETGAGGKITVYPTPAESVLISLVFQTGLMARDKSGAEKLTLEAEHDTLNIADPVYRALFENALVSLTACNLIQDTADENFAPYLEHYRKALEMLTRYGAHKKEKRIVI